MSMTKMNQNQINQIIIKTKITNMMIMKMKKIFKLILQNAIHVEGVLTKKHSLGIRKYAKKYLLIKEKNSTLLQIGNQKNCSKWKEIVK